MSRWACSQQLLEPVVLGLQVTQPLRLAGLHAAKARAPLVERRVAEAALTADVLDRNTGLGLLEKPDDLLVGEPALAHVRSFLWKRTLLTLRWYALRGAGQIDRASQRALPHESV
jgi:hypothetical protein